MALWALALFLLTVGLPVAAGAADVVLDLDPAQSTVDFTLGAFLHTVHGSFKVKGGTIRLDTATGKAQGEIDVDLTTGSTGIGARDAVVHGSVLESRRYPDAVFTPDTVSGNFNPNGASTLDISGRLAIHGAVHDWTFHAVTATGGHGAVDDSLRAMGHEESKYVLTACRRSRRRHRARGREPPSRFAVTTPLVKPPSSG